MSITSWSPQRELEAFRERFNRLLTEHDGWPTDLRDGSMMPIDLQETDDKITVTATMPGIKAEDLEIDVRNGALHIRGESSEEREESEGTWHRRERRFGKVERTISLPTQVDAAQADAKVADGVLTVTLPKQESTPSEKIKVKQG